MIIDGRVMKMFGLDVMNVSIAAWNLYLE